MDCAGVLQLLPSTSWLDKAMPLRTNSVQSGSSVAWFCEGSKCSRCPRLQNTGNVSEFSPSSKVLSALWTCRSPTSGLMFTRRRVMSNPPDFWPNGMRREVGDVAFGILVS